MTYPVVLQLQNEFAKQGLQTVFVTKIYGYFEDKTKISTQEELRLGEKYWAEEHKLTGIPVGVAETPVLPDSTDSDRPDHAPAKYDMDYSVKMVPTFAVIDSKGIIRFVSSGFDRVGIRKTIQLLLSGL
jgi:hypothetical protein